MSRLIKLARTGRIEGRQADKEDRFTLERANKTFPSPDSKKARGSETEIATAPYPEVDPDTSPDSADETDRFDSRYSKIPDRRQFSDLRLARNALKKVLGPSPSL